MPKKLQDLVEDPKTHPGVETDRTMPEAASSGETLGGYAAINAVTEGDANDSAIAQLAHEIYLQRQREGTPGSAESDWVQAESQLRLMKRSDQT
jgi:hypothetical protein